MLVSEYCSECDKKTMRKTSECPECTPKNAEAQNSTYKQQLKAKIAGNILAARKAFHCGDESLFELAVSRIQQLSAV